MARLPRRVIAGQPHLVIQRANSLRLVFTDDTDRFSYLATLADAARRYSIAVHAYVLMDDHVSLLVTPPEAKSLGRFMQYIARRYVPDFNRRHGTQGPLWVGRFQSATVEADRYVLRATYLIEQAPMRAGRVAHPQDWKWSSAGHHVGRHASALVTEHAAFWRLGNTPFEREARHEIELRHTLAEDEVAELLSAARGGWVLGSTAYVAAAAKETGRRAQPGPRGRPRRSQ